jgi:hypothetical protein
VIQASLGFPMRDARVDKSVRIPSPKRNCQLLNHGFILH